MNCRKSNNKIYHFTSNLLPHYLAKIECSIAELFIQSINMFIYRL